MRRPLALLLLTLAIVLAVPGAAFAVDYYVAVSGDDVAGAGTPASPFASVQKAVDAAAASGGGTVYVGPGTFTGTVTLRNGVSLRGAGADLTTLTVTSGRVIIISGIGAGETVSGFTITGGSAASGGGIYILNSSPLIERNVITGNAAFDDGSGTAGRGGGIYCSGGAPVIENNLIADNDVSGSYPGGAGIAAWNSTVTIRGNTIIGNTVSPAEYGGYGGGGISCYGGGGSIRLNIIADNVAAGDGARGGGIAVTRTSLLIADNTIARNTAGGESSSAQGGGICASWGAPTMTGNWITDNAARGNSVVGGGIAFDAGFDPNAPTIGANIISGNIADGVYSGRGGGLDLADGTPRLLGNVISGNTVRAAYAAEGGGAYVSAFWDVVRPVITNNVIADNAAIADYGPSGAGLYFDSSAAVLRNNTIARNQVQGNSPGAGGITADDFWGNGRPDIKNCIVWGNTGAELLGCSAAYSCVEGGASGVGNIAADPLFASAAAGDYRLSAGSPASEVASATIAPAIDLRGVARPQGPGVDMGAYEYVPPVPVPPAAADESYTVNEDTTLAVYGRGVLADDTVVQDGAPLTASVTTGPAHGTLVLDPRGAFTYLPDVDWSGTDWFQYTVTDAFGAMDVGTVTITVVPTPAPVIGAIEDMASDELDLISFGVVASDTDVPAQTITFSLGGVVPEGASIDTTTGAFVWTPSEAQGPGTFEIRVHATDGLYVDAETFTVTVAEVASAPVLDAIGDRAVDESVEVTFTATATDPDIPVQTLAFSLGAGAPAGASIDGATGAFSWTPTETQDGAHAVQVVVSDGSLTATETITITVAEVNLAPELGAVGNRSVDEGAELAFTAAASDADLPANTLTFSLGAGAPAGATIDPVTGAFAWTPTEAQGPGEYPITITVSDGALSDSETFTVTAAEVSTAPVLGEIGARSVSEGVELAFTATATDADLPANTFTFELGAGAPAGATIDPATGAFSWTPTEAQGPGTFDVTVTVSDGALTASATFTVTVAEAGIIPVLGAIENAVIDEGNELTFTATATDADLPAQTLTFALGAGAPAGATIDPATGVFSWTPSEAQGPGTYEIRVTVSDGELAAAETFSVTVAEVNVAPQLGTIGDKSVHELTRFTFTATATDADLPAQALVYSFGAGAPAGAAIDPATGAFTWTPTEAQGPRRYPLTIIVSDGTLTDSETITVTVREVAAPKPPATSGSTSPAEDEGTAPTAAAAPVAGSDPAAPETTAPTAGEDSDEEPGDDPVADTPDDDPIDEESGFPWWIVVLVLALGGLGLFGVIARGRASNG